ncbi:hypothetical protein GCM10023225_01910 [Kineococcus glutinatus]|uniref:Sec-independent protein translocase protein TatA n=2 Tax=Kineococcus glutinatus TaxID=1070872 RepID=A0ABP9H5Y2_9ACTN
MFRNLFDHPAVLVVLVVLVIALFFSKRLPDAARGLGRSMRILKSEVKELKRDDAAPPSASADGGVVEGRVDDDTRPGTSPTHTGTSGPGTHTS